jgi:sugar phosphate isomerase/epimerase
VAGDRRCSVSGATTADRPLGLSSSALPGWGIDQIAGACAEAGLDGVEWGVGAGQVVTAADLKLAVQPLELAARTAGLRCSGISAHDEDALGYPMDTWKWLAQLAAELGAPHVRVYAGPARALRITEGWNELVEQLSACSAVTEQAGVRLLVEPAPTTLVPGPILAMRALAGLNPDVVGIVYDPGSLAREGWIAPHLAVPMLGALLRHVHVKNMAPVQDSARWRWRPATIEAGIVDWPSVLSALDSAGYQDWFILDHLSGETAMDVLLSDVARLRRLIGAGLNADG